MRGRAAASALVALLVALTCTGLEAQPTVRIVGSGWVLAPAVASTASGTVGAMTNITLVVIEGGGRVYVSTMPLTDIDMQGSAQAAVRAACTVLGVDCDGYDFLFTIQSPSVVVGGPSAGLVMSVLVASVLAGRPLNRTVMATGMITPSGSVGPVGGILEKANASAQAGARVFLVPLGQTIVTTYVRSVERRGPFVFTSVRPVSVNVSELALREWGLEVVEVTSLEEALRYFLGLRTERVYTMPQVTARAESTAAEAARLMLERVRKSADECRGELGALPRGVREALQASLQDALGRAEAALNMSDPLAATYSLATQLVNVEWIRLIAEYYMGRDISSYVNNVASRINWTGNMGVLEAFYIARAEEALELAKTLWSSNVETSLYMLAQAAVFATLPGYWGDTGGVLSFPEAEEQALKTIVEAGHTWSYAYIVISESGLSAPTLDEAGTAYQLAKEYLAEKRYLPAIIHGLIAIALSENSLDTLTISAAGSAKSKRLVDYVRDQALYYTSLAPEGARLLPLILVKSAEAAPQPLASLQNYRLALNVARLLSIAQLESASPGRPILTALDLSALELTATLLLAMVLLRVALILYRRRSSRRPPGHEARVNPY